MLNNNKHGITCNTQTCDSLIKYLLAFLILVEIVVLSCILYLLMHPEIRQVTFNIINQY